MIRYTGTGYIKRIQGHPIKKDKGKDPVPCRDMMQEHGTWTGYSDSIQG